LTVVFKLEILDAFNDAGTFGAFGFLGAYFLISLAAPAYLKRSGILRGRDIALSVASVILLLLPAVGSVYPVPSWPVNIFPYIFIGYLLIGMVWYMMLRQRSGFTEQVRETVYVDHAPSAGPAVPLKSAQSRVTAA
jgi:hypothetical protein